MFKLGEIQELTVVKKVQFGVYLSDSENEDERVLLPKKEVPEGTETGTAISVFLYRDSEDRIIATTMFPTLTLGKLAVLTVKEVGRIGAFLDWGLAKDLFLPFKEQTVKVNKGEKVLVTLYKDKSDRLCATMKVYSHLKKNAPYVIGDEVSARVYEINDRFGVYVAVDDQYSGLIPKKDAQGKFYVGEVLKARVTQVHEDGKVDVAPRQKAYLQLEPDGDLIMERLKEYRGTLPFDDRADPEVIKNEFGMSKAAFKRAVGHLMKEKKVHIANGKIYLNK